VLLNKEAVRTLCHSLLKMIQEK